MIWVYAWKNIEAQIRAIFEQSTDQYQCLEAIYRLFLPDWETIEEIKGWPVCGMYLWHFIADQFQAFDMKHHPDCLPGGLWMNKGFSWRENLQPFEIDLDYCTIKRSV